MPGRLSIEVRVPRDRDFLGEISTTRASGYVSAKSASARGFDSPQPGTYRMKTLAEFAGRVTDPRAVRLYGPGIVFFEALDRQRGRKPRIVPIYGGEPDAFGKMIQTDGGLRVTNEYMQGLLADVKASGEVTLTIVEAHLGFFRRWFRPKVSNTLPQYPVRDQSDPAGEPAWRSSEETRRRDDDDDHPFWYWLMTRSDRSEPDRAEPASRGGQRDTGGEKRAGWYSVQDPAMGPNAGRKEEWRVVEDDALRAKPDAGDPVIIDPFAEPTRSGAPTEIADNAPPAHQADQASASASSETVDMAAAEPTTESAGSSGTAY